MTSVRRVAGLAAVVAAWLAATARVDACPICFRAEESPTTAGVEAAVWVLAGVTVTVLAGIGAWLRGTELFSTDPGTEVFSTASPSSGTEVAPDGHVRTARDATSVPESAHPVEKTSVAL